MDIIDRKETLKNILEDYPTLEQQLEIEDLFGLDILEEYYVKEKRRDIAIKFNEKRKNLLKF